MATRDALALLRITLPDGSVRTEPITETPFNLGRVADNHVALPDPKVSRNHARLLVEGDRIHLIDLNSTNGTMVGESQLVANQPYPLSYGQEFQIGRYTLRLEPIAPVIQPEAESTGEMAMAPEEPPQPPPKPATMPTLELAPEAAPRPEEGRPATVTPEPQPVPRVRLGVTEAPPPPRPPSEPPLPPGADQPLYDEAFGLPPDRSRYLQHLPPIYDEHPFLGMFLLVLEGILTPIEQTVDNFDLYLDPHTAPAFFLDQLASWLGMTLDEKWPEEKRRAIVAEAAELYRRRGTRWGLGRHLELYTGAIPEITEPRDRPHHFHVLLRLPANQATDRATVERIIEANKPAHTTYSLEILQSR